MSRVDIHNRWQVRDWVEANIPDVVVREDYRGLVIRHKNDKNKKSYIRVCNHRSLVSYNHQTRRRYVFPGPKGRGWTTKMQESIARRVERIWGTLA